MPYKVQLPPNLKDKNPGNLLRSLPVEKAGTVGTASDPYSARMQAALATISQPDYPAGMIPWLGQARPDLYDELTSRIPDEINLAWKCRAVLAEFDAILARLVQTHQQACELYRKHLQKPAQGVLERAPGTEQPR